MGWRGALHVQADGAHQFQSVAVLDDAGAEAVVEAHAPLFDLVADSCVIVMNDMR